MFSGSNLPKFSIAKSLCYAIIRISLCIYPFSQVTGNTVFNMIRFNEILTDKDDRPIGEPPKIVKTEVST